MFFMRCSIFGKAYGEELEGEKKDEEENVFDIIDGIDEEADERPEVSDANERKQIRIC